MSPTAPEHCTPRLLVRQGSEKPYEVQVTRFPFRVGREPDNDLRLTDSAVSGHHFRLRLEHDTIFIDDLDSSNGTYLNQSEERVTTAPVTDRTRITVGRQTRISVRIDRPPPPAATVPIRESVVVSDLQSLSARVSEVAESYAQARTAPLDSAADPEMLRTLSVEAKAALEQSASAYARLAALYEATGFVISGVRDLQQCLNNVLDTALSVMQGDRGFVLLRDETTGALDVEAARDVELGTPEARGSMGIAEKVAATGEPVLTVDAGTEFGERESVVLQEIRSVLCVPLRIEEGETRRTIGVLYVDSLSGHKQFMPEDQELLTAFAHLAAIVIENTRLFTRLQQEERLRDRMGRNLPRAVVQKLIDAGETWGPGGDEQFITVMDCDIRGFTALSEKLTPHETIDLLNYYFGEMTQIVFAHEGTLDKFMGDGLMAIFGAPYTRDDDATRAVQCALAMVLQMAPINEELTARGLPALRIGIGLNSGIAIAGNVGSSRRMDYTVVGDTVNVACRLQSAARPVAESDDLGIVLIAQSTYELVKDSIRASHAGDFVLRGKEAPLPAFRAEGAVQ